MIYYFVNWMGPINKKWIDDNGRDWSAGRIDISDGSPHGNSYSLATMKTEDFNALRDFLRTYSSRRVRSFDRIISDFEKFHGKIRWFKRGE